MTKARGTLLAMVLACGVGVRPAAGFVSTCSIDGRYLVSTSSLLDGDAVLVEPGDVLTLDGGTLVMANGCSYGRARWARHVPRVAMRGRCAESQRETSKRRIKHKVWFDNGCERIRGRIRWRRAVTTYSAARSFCGDSWHDAGAGEECDGGLPPGATCPGDPLRDPVTCVRCLESCRVAPRLIPIESGDVELAVFGSGRFAVLRVEPSAYARWRLAATSLTDVQEIVTTIYDTFNDVFDFIVLVADEDAVAEDAEAYGRYSRVKNDVDGLGMGRFDDTASFGSSGALQGVIELPSRAGIRGPLLHEILHRWANFLNAWPADTVGRHWGFSSVGGQLGGWQEGTLVDQGGGAYAAEGPQGHVSFTTVANGGNGVPYADIELYLMGLATAAEVRPLFQAALEAEYIDQPSGTFRATSVVTFTMADVIAANGPRMPPADQAQHAFRSLIVLLTPGAPEPSTADYFDVELERFARLGEDEDSSLYNFWEATRGRATMRLDGLFEALRIAPTASVAPR